MLGVKMSKGLTEATVVTTTWAIQHVQTMVFVLLTILLPLRSTVVRASARGAGGRGSLGFNPRLRHTKDVKTGRFALLSLALGINELGNRLGGSESV